MGLQYSVVIILAVENGVKLLIRLLLEYVYE